MYPEHFGSKLSRWDVKSHSPQSVNYSFFKLFYTTTKTGQPGAMSMSTHWPLNNK